MLPAEGGASPEATLLLSMPTGFFSIKLLYIVQAGFQTNASDSSHLHDKMQLLFFISYSGFTSFWFHSIDSGLITA